jgi:hypothetical protein
MICPGRMVVFLLRMTVNTVECQFTLKGNLPHILNLDWIGKGLVTEKTAAFNNVALLVTLYVGIRFLVFLLSVTQKAECCKHLIGGTPDKCGVSLFVGKIIFHLKKGIVAGKAGDFPVFEGKIPWHNLLHWAC